VFIGNGRMLTTGMYIAATIAIPTKDFTKL